MNAYLRALIYFNSILSFLLIFNSILFANEIVWSFETLLSTEDYYKEAVITDLDGDNDIDIVLHSMEYDSLGWHSFLGWYEYLDGTNTFSEYQLINADSRFYAISLLSADIEGDGDQDLIISNDDHDLLLYEFDSGQDCFLPESIIATSTWLIKGLDYTDVDNDYDADIVAFNWNNSDIWWYENLGDNSFGHKNVLETDLGHVRGVESADLDGDNDLDIIIYGEGSISLMWLENTDGQGSFELGSIIYSGNPAYRFYSITCYDYNNDGDIDIIASSNVSMEAKILIFENINGHGDFDNFTIASENTSLIFNVHCCDLDGDSDVDIIATDPYYVRWLENLDGQGHFSPLRNSRYDPVSTYKDLVDFDLDGDIDIIMNLPQGGRQGGLFYLLRNVETVGVKDVDPADRLAESFEITSAYPNPFNMSQTVEITLPSPSELTVSVYNLLGERVAELASGRYSAGGHSFTFDAGNLASGIYIVQASVPGHAIETQKVVLMK